MEKKLLCLVLAFVFAVGLGLTARARIWRCLRRRVF